MWGPDWGMRKDFKENVIFKKNIWTLSSSRILLVKYSANEGKLRFGICMDHFHLTAHFLVFSFLVYKMGIIPLKVGHHLVAQMVKKSACKVGDPSSVPRW